MDCMKLHFLMTFVCVAAQLFMSSDADQQNSSSFLSSYVRQQDICHKIGWEPKCGGCKGEVIAFHAILSNSLNNVPKKTIIKFTNVALNKGNGYNPITGKFTAPMDGVYSFSWTYHTASGSKNYLFGFVNGKPRAMSGTVATSWQNTSGHLVAILKKGDQFWVENSEFTASLIYHTYTYVSGYKIDNGC